MCLFSFFQKHPKLKPVSHFCLLFSEISLLLLVFLFPLFFLPWMLDPLGINKQVLLVFFITLISFGLIGFFLSEKRYPAWSRLPSFLLIGFFLSVVLSVVFSHQGFVGWIGGSGQDYTSVLSLGAFLFLFQIVSIFPDTPLLLRRITWSLVGSSVLVAIVGLSSLFHIFLLPFSFAQSQVFNTIGTVNAWAIFLCVVTVLGQSVWLLESEKKITGRKIKTVSILLLSFLTLIALILIDYWMLWTVLLIGFGTLFTIIFFRKSNQFPNFLKLFLPLLMGVVAIFLLILPRPFSANVPAEITPSVRASWNITVHTLQNSSWVFGSGPGTFPTDYETFHDTSLNNTPFWNIRFDHSHSFFLTLLPTIGLLGSLFFLGFITILFFKNGRRVFFASSGEGNKSLLFFPAWTALTAAFFLYPANLSLLFLWMVLGGCLVATVTPPRPSLIHFHRWFLIPFLFVCVGIAVMGGFLIARARADIAFAEGIRLERQTPLSGDAIKLFDKAASLNQFQDVYFRTLAQALFAQVQDLLQNKQGGDQNAAHLQSLIASSVNAAVRATELQPKNALNWRVRASGYQLLIPVLPDAGTFAISSFEEAARLEPVNPISFVDLGEMYMAMAAQASVMEKMGDKQVSSASRDQYLQKAQAYFEHALELKQDFAPAHYQLAVLFEQQGKLDDAIGKMESVIRYNSQDAGAFFQLGTLYLRRNAADDRARARQVLERSVYLVPTYTNAMWLLASIYEQEGRIADATALVERVLKLNPDNSVIKERLEKLKAGAVSMPLSPTPPPL